MALLRAAKAQITQNDSVSHLWNVRHISQLVRPAEEFFDNLDGVVLAARRRLARMAIAVAPRCVAGELTLVLAVSTAGFGAGGATSCGMQCFAANGFELRLGNHHPLPGCDLADKQGEHGKSSD